MFIHNVPIKSQNLYLETNHQTKTLKYLVKLSLKELNKSPNIVTKTFDSSLYIYLVIFF